MINKLVKTMEEALSGLRDGMTIMISGFGDAGVPFNLINGVFDKGIKDLIIISNNAGRYGEGISKLLRGNRVRKIICSYPRSLKGSIIEEKYRKKEVELELLPQGTLAERIRCGGAGIGGFYTRTGLGTILTSGKETKIIDGIEYVLELPLKADFALIRAEKADRWGNLIFRKTARNFGPIMCMAGDVTVVEVKKCVEIGEIDPENIITPGIFVDRILEIDPQLFLPDGTIMEAKNVKE
ncbi:MAG: 3-oxoacid CoA-transferase subunit A [Nitrososphaeria archaeon]